jgi:hypothetical protein
MQILMKYMGKLLTAGDVSEVHLWDRTKVKSDEFWLEGEALAPVQEGNRAQVTTFQKKDSAGLNMNSITSKWGTVYAHYGRNGKFKPLTPVALEDTMFVKADDDIVYMDISKFKSFATYVLKHPDMFIVHANVVNNQVAAYHQSHHIKALGEQVPAITEEPPTEGGGSLFTDEGERALALHRFFLEHREAFSWEDSTNENCIQFRPGRFSINFFGARGENMDKIDEIVSKACCGDEHALTFAATRNDGLRECMYTPFTVAHLSFGPQHKLADGILPAYEALWESLHGHKSSLSQSIFSDEESVRSVVRRSSYGVRTEHLDHTPAFKSTWGRIVEDIKETFDLFNDAGGASLLRTTAEEASLSDPTLLQNACASLGNEPYFVSQYPQMSEYTNFVNNRIPTLAELQKMPDDQLAMQKLMRNLAQKSSIRVAVLGGSMTIGNECTTPDKQVQTKCAWSAGLERWLTRTFPSAAVNVDNLGYGGMNTLARLLEIDNTIGAATKYGRVDLWIIDHGINDAVADERRDHVNWFGDANEDFVTRDFDALGNTTRDDVMSIATEALILKILRTDPTAGLMLLSTACAECLAFRENELKIARHYRVPYVDYAFLVEQRGQECEVQIDSKSDFGRRDENGRFLVVQEMGASTNRPRNCDLWNGTIHPDWKTHQRVADTMGYLMGRALAAVCRDPKSGSDMMLLVAPQASTFWSKPALHSLAPCDKFAVSYSAKRSQASVIKNGWDLVEDRAGKPGWIGTTAGARISFPLTFGADPTIGIGFLRSYENMGKASVQVVGTKGEFVPLGEIDGLWEDPKARISVLDTKWFYPKVGSKTNEMTLVVDIADMPRASNKMKILSVVSC